MRNKIRSPQRGHELADHELVTLVNVVDETIDRGFRWMYFPKRLEAIFERETGAARARHLIIGGLVAIITYDLFLLSDYTMIADIFKTALIVRLGIMTPLAFLIMAGLHYGLAPLVRESIESGVTVLVSASLIYFLCLSQHPNAVYYHSGLLLVMAFGNIVVRLRFWYAVFASLATLLLYIFTAPNAAALPPPAQLNNVIVLGSNVVFTLFANYTLEQDHRRSYLLALRERIRRATLTAHNAKLAELSHLDPLTGIPNRREFDEYLEHLRSEAQGVRRSLVMLDVDCFKSYNDHYGHPAGDECLKNIAKALQASIRQQGDMVARFGGEEFVAVLPGADVETAKQVAERFRQAVLKLAMPHVASPIANCVTLSAGVATTVAAFDPQSVLAAADAALYRAKSAGRNCVRD